MLGFNGLTLFGSLKAVKTALKTLNPFAAIGAGIALIAIGSAHLYGIYLENTRSS